jgi:hypothetical protein
MAAVARRDVLRVAAVVGQAREIGSPAVARFVTADHRRAALDVVETPSDVVERVRDGRASVGIIDLPAPATCTPCRSAGRSWCCCTPAAGGSTIPST